MSETTTWPSEQGSGEMPSADGSGGRWAVVTAALGVLATAAACLTFFTGYLGIARLPGDIPPMDAIPRTEATRVPLLQMQVGLGLFGLAAVLCLVGLVAGIRLWRSATGYRSGAWAIALAACAPILAIMMLAGMGAT
ncbi:hypothetical protein [Luteococcus peritonei]|uniref:DUF4064 domain-containing protein n=1 Tax=Luteococcus peritonei TaxID=88874 RepID=A0ABW4RXJ6_9ACTN